MAVSDSPGETVSGRDVMGSTMSDGHELNGRERRLFPVNGDWLFIDFGREAVGMTQPPKGAPPVSEQKGIRRREARHPDLTF